MPKKKKGGKKKKGKKSKESDEVPDDGPSTLIGGDDGKKKKKKKPKLTKSERATLKMEKAIDLFKSNGENYLHFVDRMHRWFQANFPLAMTLFQQLDAEGHMTITADEFKAGMRDLDIPCNNVELHLLVKLLDKENSDEIDYSAFSKGLMFVREEEDASSDDDIGDDENDDKNDNENPTSALKGEDEEEEEWDEPEEKIKLHITQRKFPKCACCGLSVCEPYRETSPRFIELELRMITFDKYSRYPGHIQGRIVHAHTSIEGIIELIREEASILSTTITIFRSATYHDEDILFQNTTLADNGFTGGTYTDPEVVRLYYDYIPEFRDCPILLCEQYSVGKA